MTPTPPPAPGQQSRGAPPARPSWHFLLMLLGVSALVWTWSSRQRTDEPPRVDYSRLYEWVSQGEVASVELRGQRALGTLKKKVELEGREVERVSAVLPHEDASWLPLLREKGVAITVLSEEEPLLVRVVLSLLPWVLLIGVWLWLSRRARSMLSAGPGGALSRVLGSRGKRFEAAGKPTVTFDDVAGLNGAKQDLREVVEFLKTPERFKKLGARVPRGVLLIGPPGTGKTLLARAVAGEAGVPFFSIAASEFIELFVGVGASRVRELFDEARKHAPAIVFIDELDAVGRSRGAGLGGGHDEREQTLNQLLSEMDGFDREALTVVLAATNRPDVLDPALLRPGRFDRRVMVDRPERQARKAILQVHARGKPVAPDVDLETLAATTAGFSGADLANLMNEGALGAARRGAESITTADLLAAYDKVVLGNPRDAKLDEREKRRVAVHEAGHAVTAWFTKDAEPPKRVSIIPRGMSLGVTHQGSAEDRHLMTRQELNGRLDVLMAGYAAERALFGDVSTGAENDLRQATALAAKMVANFGMSDAVGPAYYEHNAEHPFLGQRIATDSGTSEATLQLIDAEARRLLAEALGRAGAVVEQHREALERLVRALLEDETIEAERLHALLGDAGPVNDARLEQPSP